MSQPKPWQSQRPRDLSSSVAAATPTNPTPTPQPTTAPAPTANQTSTPLSQTTANTTLSGTLNTPYTSPYSSTMSRPMYRPGMMYGGGMYGGGMYGGGMYGGGMYGGGMYGGGMYGGGMYGGMYGQSPGMMAVERFAMIVESLCFTAQTIEQSMHSMSIFWEAAARIKGWGETAAKTLGQWVMAKCRSVWNFFLFLIGKRSAKQENITFRRIAINLFTTFMLFCLIKFLWKEFTKPTPPNPMAAF